MTARRRNRSGAETRDRIIDAALDVVRSEGLVGASARTIARHGDFNQALLFYHFGTVEQVLLAALERANERRMERFGARLESVTSLPDLVAVAVELHGDDDDPDHPALAAIVAGWSQNSELGPEVRRILDPWHEMVAAALRRSLDSSPLGQVLPVDDLAFGISALFLGVELLSRLDPESDDARRFYASVSGMARWAEPALGALLAQQAAVVDPAE